MLIKKVKVTKNDGITVVATHNEDGKSTDISLHSDESPSPTLMVSLKKAIPLAIDICELKKDSDIKMLGISVSYHGEDQVAGVIMTISKKLADGNTCITINTPLKYLERAGDKTSEASILNTEDAAIIESIMLEGKEYLEGIREQTNLFV